MQDRSSTSVEPSETEPSVYGRALGERLRAIRRQKRLSLQAVEETSNHEFKASVLGAYERGERAISVLRLQRLAKLYRVPVDQLLPEGVTANGTPGTNGDGTSPVIDLTERAGKLPTLEPVTIDLARLERLPGPEVRALGRFLRMVQLRRQDFNGRMLTVRADDVRVIAAILDVEAEEVVGRLDELGLRLVRN